MAMSNIQQRFELAYGHRMRRGQMSNVNPKTELRVPPASFPLDEKATHEGPDRRRRAAGARAVRQLIDDIGEHEVVGEAGNGQEGRTGHSAQNQEAGRRAARHSHAGHGRHRDGAPPEPGRDSPPAVVFTTAYDEYAIDAFEANAIGYVLKPIRRRTARAGADAGRPPNRVKSSSDIGKQSGSGIRAQARLCADCTTN